MFAVQLVGSLLVVAVLAVLAAGYWREARRDDDGGLAGPYDRERLGL